MTLRLCLLPLFQRKAIIMNILNRDKFKDQITQHYKTMKDNIADQNKTREEMRIKTWEHDELGEGELTIHFEDGSITIIQSDRLYEYLRYFVDREDRDRFLHSIDTKGQPLYDLCTWVDQLRRDEVEHIFWTHLKGKI